MQMQVGSFRFEAPAGVEYSELQRRRRRRWAARERHGQPAALEDLGRQAETVTLTGTVWVRGAADLDAFGVLRQEAGLARGADAAPLAVFLGGDDTTSGTFAGMWVVDRLNTRERGLRLGGIPARVDFTLQLTEHVEVEQEAEG